MKMILISLLLTFNASFFGCSKNPEKVVVVTEENSAEYFASQALMKGYEIKFTDSIPANWHKVQVKKVGGSAEYSHHVEYRYNGVLIDSMTASPGGGVECRVGSYISYCKDTTVFVVLANYPYYNGKPVPTGSHAHLYMGNKRILTALKDDFEKVFFVPIDRNTREKITAYETVYPSDTYDYNSHVSVEYYDIDDGKSYYVGYVDFSVYNINKQRELASPTYYPCMTGSVP